jgi:hypothetical protein
MKISLKQIDMASTVRQQETIADNRKNSFYIFFLLCLVVLGSLLLIGYFGATPVVLTTVFIAVLLSVITSLLLTISTNLITLMRQNDDQRLLLLASLPTEILEEHKNDSPEAYPFERHVQPQIKAKTWQDHLTAEGKKTERQLAAVLFVLFLILVWLELRGT